MKVSLDAIQFNHGTIQDTGAFNLRRNEALWVTLPEWRRRDDFTNPSCSPVAYAKSCLPGELTIKASFICDGTVACIKVRAWSGEIVEEVQPGVSAAHVLGHIAEHSIPLRRGQSGQIPLKLTNANIRNVGIGIHDITWRWQFSSDSVNWTDFQVTRHRVYIVLAIPQAPWEPKSSEPSNIHIPWTDVLDHACSWAVGVKLDLDEAAKRITHHVYALGETLVKYDAAPSYANGKFECTKFLKLLSTGIGGSQTLNCDDCATVVSSFANVLGCDLSQSGMGLGFTTNPILLIGNKYWKPETFMHHSVAWKGAALEGDALFDSCLQVDGDPPPHSLPHVAFQPVNVQFGDFRDGQYKFSFVRADSYCVPIPTDGPHGRKRRQLGRTYLADKELTGTEFVSKLKLTYSFDTWPPPQHYETAHLNDVSPPDSYELEINFPNWQLYEYERVESERFTNIFLTIFQRPAPESGELLAVNLYECRDLSDTNNFVLQVLSAYAEILSRVESPGIGELAFNFASGLALLFRRGRFVAVVRSAGRQSFSVLEIATSLDQFLNNHVGQDR